MDIDASTSTLTILGFFVFWLFFFCIVLFHVHIRKGWFWKVHMCCSGLCVSVVTMTCTRSVLVSVSVTQPCLWINDANSRSLVKFLRKRISVENSLLGRQDGICVMRVGCVLNTTGLGGGLWIRRGGIRVRGGVRAGDGTGLMGGRTALKLRTHTGKVASVKIASAVNKRQCEARS